MEIPAWVFFSFCSFTGVWSLYLGMVTLNNTDLPTSVSPKILFFFKHFLATAACYSSTYALVFRTKMKIPAPTYFIWFSFAIFPIASFTKSGYYPNYTLFNMSVVIFYFLPWTNRILGPIIFYFQSIGIALVPLLNFWTRSDSFITISISNFIVLYHLHFAAIEEQQLALIVHYYSMAILFITLGLKDCSPLLVLSSAFFTLVAHAAIQRWLPAAGGEDGVLRRMMKNNGKVIEFAIGIAATILFQNFFQLTSLDHITAFLLFAVAWLANLGLLLCRHDFGVFNFLLGNVIVGCSVSQFGLRGSTWIAYAASLLLYFLRVKLELVCVVDRGEAKAEVLACGENQIAAVEDLLPRFQ